MLRKWLKSGYMESHVFHPTEEGTPQGGLSLRSWRTWHLTGWKPACGELLLWPQESSREPGAPGKVRGRLRDHRQLERTARKRSQAPGRGISRGSRAGTLAREDLRNPYRHGFDFLGQNVRKYDGKLLIKPSKANVATFLANIREVVKTHKTLSAGHLVTVAQSQNQGMGDVSPAHLRQAYLHLCRSRDLQDPMAVVRTKTPEQRQTLDRSEVFYHASGRTRRGPLGVLR